MDPWYNIKLLNFTMFGFYHNLLNVYDIRFSKQDYDDLLASATNALIAFLNNDNGLTKFNVYDFVEDHNN